MCDLIYLDHAATTAVHPDVLKEMLPYFTERLGNPSSVYGFAANNKNKLTEARETIAGALGAKPEEIYFTAGGSESDNWALKCTAEAYGVHGGHIITTKIEHHAILHTCKYLQNRGYDVTYLDVDENGLVDLNTLEAAIRPDTFLISIMFANNEIGTIEPIKEIGEIAHRHGFLYIKKGLKLKSFIHGGQQERGRRAGTENVPGIVGIAKACEIAMAEMEERMKKETELRDYLIERILKEIPYTRLNGHSKKRLPNNVNISFQFVEGESILIMLDMACICASSGSACTSGSVAPSHVLLAIGLPHEIAHGSLRLTIGYENTKEEMDTVVDNLKRIITNLRNMSPLYEDYVKKNHIQ